MPWVAFAGGLLALHLLTGRIAVPPVERAWRIPRWQRPAVKSPPRVSVVIPALNEAANLRQILPRMPDGLHEVILVDGGSVDGTVAVAREEVPEVRVLRQGGQGKGDALQDGFAAVTGDVIVMLDADGSADPAEIPSFVDTLRGGADFAKGSRFLEGGGSSDITRLRRAGNRGLVGLVNLLFGTRYSDLCYGYNAFWTSCLPRLSVDVPGFEVETLINLRVAAAGMEVREVPSYEFERLHGESHLNPFRDGMRVLRTIGRELRRQSRNEVSVGAPRRAEASPDLQG